MADLSTVEAFAKRWLSTGHVLDILANNAGMGKTASGKLTKTKDGFELVHQVNNNL
jgi:NAD(P)-dependent dehydrogenase (short-subunit alcohol dehydrogenase family)